MVVTKLEELLSEIKGLALDAAVGKKESLSEGDKHMADWYDGKLDGLCSAMTAIVLMKDAYIKDGI